MSSYGSLEIVREILDIDPGEEDLKLTRFLSLSNVWINTLAPSDVLSNLDSDTLNMAVNLHTVFLFRLTAEKFTGEESPIAMRYKDEGTELIKQSILNKNNIYKIRKVNKYSTSY